MQVMSMEIFLIVPIVLLDILDFQMVVASNSLLTVHNLPIAINALQQHVYSVMTDINL